MKTFVNTGNHVHGSENLTERIETMVENALGRFAPRISRVEVHLEDVNSEKGGSDDKRCLMEARLEGLQPVASHHEAETMTEAIEGAAGKLERVIESTFGKLSAR